MTNDNKDKSGQAVQSNNLQETNKAKEALPVHNPLDTKDHRQITQEDIENEQKYKEALTERD